MTILGNPHLLKPNIVSIDQTKYRVNRPPSLREAPQPATITRHEGDTEVAPAKTSYTGIANKYDDGFTVISLPLTHVNPSSQASVDAVLEHFAEESKLGGGIGQRKWEFIVADLGATNMKDVDDPSTISGQSFFSVMCTGHEMFAQS